MEKIKRKIRPSLSFLKGLKKTIDYSSKNKLFTMFDYWKLNVLKGITPEEYFQFELERQDYDFRKSFPVIKAAGWDIVITEEGPLVIEINDMWDRTGQYFIIKGWRYEIRECYFAWKRTGVKYPFIRANNRLNNIKLQKIVSYE